MPKKLVIAYGALWGEKPDFGKNSKFYGSESLESVYRSFAKEGKKHGFDVYMSNYKWTEKGKFSKGWLITQKGFEKAFSIKPDIVYDKMKFNERTKSIRKSFSSKTRFINHSYLENAASDKYLTYRLFPKIVPKTFEVNSSKELRDKIKKIEGGAVLKPRRGSSAQGIIYGSREHIISEAGRIREPMVLQEMIDTSCGIPGISSGVSDLRIVIIGGKIDHAYVRSASCSDFFSNISRGGKVRFVDTSRIPKSVVSAVKAVDSRFSRLGPRLYTADFVYEDKKRFWLIELNSKPLTRYPKRIMDCFLSSFFIMLKKAI